MYPNCYHIANQKCGNKDFMEYPCVCQMDHMEFWIVEFWIWSVDFVSK